MADINVEEVLAELSLDEKITLTAGRDFWHTNPIPRMGLPAIRFSDGPNGVRGTRFFNSVPAACLPCATALGATWDVTLMKAVGQLIGREAKAKGAHVVLGPTINLQRSPLGGRGFESFAEDPFLSGILAAAYCNGLQGEGIVATLKHFVCNDLEDQRKAVNVIVSDRALREIYLMPFMLAIRDSKPGVVMTAYNKLNGIHCSENGRLLKDILRKEWGFEGAVISDWFGTYSTTEAILAGLDVEMPGPTQWRNVTLTNAVTANKLSEDDVSDRARNVLNLIKCAYQSGIGENAKEGSRDSPEDRDILRKAAADSIVLMKNDENILPLAKNKTTAVIGPNAEVATFCGGGSATLSANYTVAPLDAVRSKCANVRFSQGAYSHKELPLLDHHLYDASGKLGVSYRAYNDPPEVEGRECIDELHATSTNIFLTDYDQPRLKSALFYAEIEGYLTPEQSGLWDFGISVSGTARLFVDDVEVVDNATLQEPGHAFFGSGTKEVVGTVHLTAGTRHKLLVTFGSAPTSKLLRKGVVSFRKGGVRLGGCPRLEPEKAIEEAVKVAAEADQVVVFAGLNGDWETEGHDRDNMDLPPYSDILISRILEVKQNAVICIQSGTPVAMPWALKAKAIIQAWYGGNETGNGIADILYGDVNPSGKLPLTFPVRMQDSSAFINSKCEKGRMIYGEDVYVGYRYFEQISLPVLFPFGHGLSYTTFSQHDLQIDLDDDKSTVRVRIRLHNTGPRDGAEVIQVYVSQNSPTTTRPQKELRAFAKVYLLAGEEQDVEIEMPLKYATSFWDESKSVWMSEKDVYNVLVGNSSRSTFLTGEFTTAKNMAWLGL